VKKPWLIKNKAAANSLIIFISTFLSSQSKYFPVPICFLAIKILQTQKEKKGQLSLHIVHLF